jgi:alpha-L-arabinofuranosidase
MKLFKDHLEQTLIEDAFTVNGDIDALASISDDEKRITITATNKDLYKDATLIISKELQTMRVDIADIVNSDDVRAVNTFENPDLIHAESFEASLPEIKLPPHSVIRLVLKA